MQACLVRIDNPMPATNYSHGTCAVVSLILLSAPFNTSYVQSYKYFHNPPPRGIMQRCQEQSGQLTFEPPTPAAQGCAFWRQGEHLGVAVAWRHQDGRPAAYIHTVVCLLAEKTLTVRWMTLQWSPSVLVWSARITRLISMARRSPLPLHTSHLQH